MLVYELLQLEEQKEIKGHTKREPNLLFMNIETDINNLKYELHQLQSIYQSINSNINNYLNNTVLLSCFYMEQEYLTKLYNVYKDTDMISTNRQVVEINKDFVNTSKELKNIINTIIKELERQANTKQLKYIESIKKSRFYNV